MSNPIPQPIPTTYNGARFRSRTEARWAVFFDALDVRWEYESEGYVLPSGPYLPDFWLPALGWFVEIKPAGPANRPASRLCSQLAHATKHNVVLFYGQPRTLGDVIKHGASDSVASGRPSEKDSGEEPDVHVSEVFPYDQEGDDVGWDFDWFFCMCPKCGRIGLAFEGRANRVCGERCDYDPQERSGSMRGIEGQRKILDACETARTYRLWDP